MFCLKRACSRYISLSNRLRYSTGRSGLDENTKKVIDEIKQLEYRLQTDIKKKENVFEKISDEEVAAMYKELSASTPTKPKVSSDFLANLKLRFLDTRRQLSEGENIPKIGSSQEPLLQTESSVAESSTTNSIQTYTVQDFESLIYANSIAKRPEEAQKAFDMMAQYGITPSVRTFNHLIDAFANTSDVKKVMSTFKKLKEQGLSPDMYTYATIVKAFVVSERIDDALAIFERMKVSSIVPSQPIFANIISGCLKADRVDQAWETFDLMRLSYHKPDEVSYTLMLHACAKRGEVEKALNLFEDMASHQLYPTDVTFNVLINACAKRPDYYNEAFSLLDQMQRDYGFSPDRITFNTLLTACARKRDLIQARHIFNTLWKESENKESPLMPDSQTFTNLFWCYASYHPQSVNHSYNAKAASSTELVIKTSLLPAELPRKRTDVIKEATMLFKLATSSDIPVTSALLNAYLATHIAHKQTKGSINIYTNTFEKYAVTKDGFTFAQMLDYCYKNKESDFCWKVWEDYQTFLETRNEELAIWIGEDQGTVMEEKAKKAKKEICAIREGWTDKQQRKLSLCMVNTLARVNDLQRSLSILETECNRSTSLGPPNLKDLMPVYNKCIQLESEEARRELLYLCTKDKRRIGASKYKRVNT
ncbi:hypothetical protein BY458DRAFT_547658 [Sporodiniella umbellata]|nr:hypothetical protein BY458DRAFT_547658 [Sporodiniella umbellata]